MKLSLNLESAEALREWANIFPIAIRNITEDTLHLIQTFQSVSDGLGEHREAFQEMLMHIQRMQENMVETIEFLPMMLNQTADKIEVYLGGSGTSATDTIGIKRLSPKDTTHYWKESQKFIDNMLTRYRQELLERGVPEGEWLKNTLMAHKAKMLEQEGYNLDVASGHDKNIDFSLYTYPDGSSSAFFDALAKDYFNAGNTEGM